MQRSGLTTVECLVALMVFTVGTLGAVASTALAIRLEAAGTRAAAASRLSGNVLDSLRSVLAARGGGCGVMAGGSSTDSRGTVASWRTIPDTGGLAIMLALRVGARSVSESLWTFTPCR